MNLPIGTFAVRASILLALAVAGVGGCASHHEPAIREQSAADADFEQGSKRPPTAKTMFALAQILATQGKDSDAQFVLRRIIAEHPDFLPAYCELAELQMRERRTEEAIRVLQSGLKLAPRDAILVNDLGMCQMMNANFDLALETFTRASGLAPDEPRYRSNMAAALGLLGRYDESLALYMNVMSPADAHYNLAVLCDARHDVKRANVEYRKAAALGESPDRKGAEVSSDGRAIPSITPALPVSPARTN